MLIRGLGIEVSREVKLLVRQGHTAFMPPSYLLEPFPCASTLCLTVCDPMEPTRGREGGPLTGSGDESVTCTVEDVMAAPGDSWVWRAYY